MIITSITAIILLPFMAEWFVANMPATLSGTVKRSPAFYILAPLIGAIVYGSFAVVTGRPFMALVGSLLFFGGLTAISNTKYRVLRDPFNAHDFDNLRNLYIYPEFYISFVGWPIMIGIIGVFSAGIAISLYAEPAFSFYTLFPYYTGWPIILVVWFTGLNIIRRITTCFFNETTAEKYGVTINLQTDVARFGLFPTVLLYRLLLKATIDKKNLRERAIKASISIDKPHDIIAIQGESYFDIERLFKKLPNRENLTWEAARNLEKAGIQTGLLTVPSWGAYTMQTEFGFLSGLANNTLGIDRINPYMRFSQKPTTTIASTLKETGYRTICIHPSHKEFFRRMSVMPNLGFEEFIGIEAFGGAPVYGKYISDTALAEKIDEIIAEHHASSDKPLFIFAITIESHGPWGQGRLARHLDEKMLLRSNVMNDPEFSIYQRHMENLLKMYKHLSIDNKTTRPRTVAMYGDHMPALGKLFDQHGFDDSRVDYMLWNSGNTPAPQNEMNIENFGASILEVAGITLEKETG